MISRIHIKKVRAMIERAAVSLPDEDALEAVELFPAWVSGVEYAVKERIRYDGTLYRCEQTHVSQSGWEPPNVPALWTAVSLDEWPEWVQPTGVQDAYQTGDKVTHNNTHWVSTVDANVWEPGVYGWDLVT